MSDIVTFELRGKVALTGLNRADKRNALNAELLEALGRATIRAGDQLADRERAAAHERHVP